MEGMFDACSYHGLFRDRYITFLCKFLTIFLFSDVRNERYQEIDALMELFEIGIKVGLVDVAIVAMNVVDEVLDFYATEAFTWVLEFSIVH